MHGRDRKASPAGERAPEPGAALVRRVPGPPAGRASYLPFWPMPRREQRGLGRCGLWEELWAAADSSWTDLLGSGESSAEDWQALARRGGFPLPAAPMKKPAETGVWF